MSFDSTEDNCATCATRSVRGFEGPCSDCVERKRRIELLKNEIRREALLLWANHVRSIVRFI
jgi:hypothetical protein